MKIFKFEPFQFQLRLEVKSDDGHFDGTDVNQGRRWIVHMLGREQRRSYRGLRRPGRRPEADRGGVGEEDLCKR